MFLDSYVDQVHALLDAIDPRLESVKRIVDAVFHVFYRLRVVRRASSASIHPSDDDDDEEWWWTRRSNISNQRRISKVQRARSVIFQFRVRRGARRITQVVCVYSDDDFPARTLVCSRCASGFNPS